MANTTPIHPQITAPKDSLAFALVFFVGFVVLLAVACTASLLTLPWRSWFPGAEAQSSVFGAVKAATYTFMSYLN
jgi:light-harvesting complex 1 beta chain